MKRVLSATASALGSLAMMLLWHPAVHGADNEQTAAQAAKGNYFSAYTLDVAIDATTFKIQREAAVLPTNVLRGDTFITEGLIYPGGTLPSGSTPFPPTSIKPIGKWVCRGVFQIGSAQIAAGGKPLVYSTQYFLLDNGTSIVTEGPEGGGDFLRAIIGGWDDGIGVRGDVLESPIGSNSTGLFNDRFTFRIRG